MDENFPSLKHFLFRGCVYGLVGALLGLSVAGLFFLTWVAIEDGGEFNFYLLIFVAGIGYGFIISFLPTIAGGYLLSYTIYRDSIKEKLSRVKAILKGIIIGAMTGFISINIFYEFLLRWRGSFRAYIINSIEVMIVASIASALTAMFLAEYLLFKKYEYSDNRFNKFFFWLEKWIFGRNL